MALITQQEDIIEHLKQNQLYSGDENIIYATLKKSWLNISYIVEGVWLAISPSKVIILPVNQMGKLTENVIVIDQSDLKTIEIKKNLLMYTLRIVNNKDEDMKFRVSSTVIGNKHHKENFEVLLNKYKIR